MHTKTTSATAQLYEMVELSFLYEAPNGSEVKADLAAEFVKDGKVTRVKGFYSGNGTYKVRFLPMETGRYTWTATGTAIPETQQGELEVIPGSSRGPVRAEGTHLVHADGTRFDSFGTTVYALAHQSDALIKETLQSLEASPFNKLRTCVFPKHYLYNYNEPEFYPFLTRDDLPMKDFHAETAPVVFPKTEEKDQYWDVSRPDYDFWDHFESCLFRLEKLGIQVDLILFHPYDRWGFSNLSMEDNLTYLDYFLRRLCAFPNIWWSIANEYDVCANKSRQDWKIIEEYISENRLSGIL